MIMHRRSESPTCLTDESIDRAERHLISVLKAQGDPLLRSYPRGGAIDRLMMVLVSRTKPKCATIYKPVFGGVFVEETAFLSELSNLSQEEDRFLNGVAILLRSKIEGTEKYEYSMNQKLGEWEQGILAYALHSKLSSVGIPSRIQAKLGWKRGTSFIDHDLGFDLEYPLLVVY